jgi:hypothetical protein
VRSTNFRIEGPDGEEIRTLDEWHEHAPPKKPRVHWQPCRSAMESARAWIGHSGEPAIPTEISALLESHELTRNFAPTLAIPEWVTRLDDYAGEHRNHDLIVIGTAVGGPTLLAVEAKADESFGDHTVFEYLKLCARREDERLRKAEQRRIAGRRPARASNAARRIAELCSALFGPPEDGEAVAELAKPLRYQLVAALAGALIEAQARKCSQVVLAIHEFLSSPDTERPSCGTDERKVARNTTDWRAFSLAVSHDERGAEGRLASPVVVPGSDRVPRIPCLLGKATRHLS